MFIPLNCKWKSYSGYGWNGDRYFCLKKLHNPGTSDLCNSCFFSLFVAGGVH